MNLDNTPTPDQLRELLAPCDDEAGNHIVWVKKNGDVVISTIREDVTSSRFEKEHQELQLQSETFLSGYGYVGPEAAQDEEWIAALFDSLLSCWSKGKGKPEVVNLPYF